MKTFPVRLLFYLSMLLLSCTASAQRLSAATDGQRPADATTQNQQFTGVMPLFDNLYYIGTSFVSAYVLKTSDGLIMIDTLYDEFTGQALTAMKAAGLDPSDIRYVLLTHGHNDHTGGIAAVQALATPTIAMSAADAAMSSLTPDIVLADGDAITLGDTTVRFYLTPGHTPGVASMLFNVADGDTTHQAFLFGGHNVTSNSKEAFTQFIESVQRLQGLLPDVEVNLTSHPWAALIYQRAALLADRKAGDPHPFVNGADFRAFLGERLQDAQSRLPNAQ